MLTNLSHVGPSTSWLFNNFPIYHVNTPGKEPYFHLEIQQGRTRLITSHKAHSHLGQGAVGLWVARGRGHRVWQEHQPSPRGSQALPSCPGAPSGAMAVKGLCGRDEPVSTREPLCAEPAAAAGASPAAPTTCALRGTAGQRLGDPAFLL